MIKGAVSTGFKNSDDSSTEKIKNRNYILIIKHMKYLFNNKSKIKENIIKHKFILIFHIFIIFSTIGYSRVFFSTWRIDIYANATMTLVHSSILEGWL